jgi:hypothetical protein
MRLHACIMCTYANHDRQILQLALLPSAEGWGGEKSRPLARDGIEFQKLDMLVDGKR